MEDNREKIAPPDPGKDSIRFGPAFLEPNPEEKDHYDLKRKILIYRNDGVQMYRAEAEKPIVLGTYRLRRKGDKLPPMTSVGPQPVLRTSLPDGRPVELILVWWPGKAPDVE